MDELNNIFEALLGGAAGAVPASSATIAPASTTAGAVTQAATTAGNAVLSGATSSVLGSVLQSVASGSATGSSSSGGGIGNTLETVAKDVLKSGLGLVPIISGLFGLFGGGDSQPLPPLVKYQRPDAIDYQAAEVGGQIANVDYNQSGAPRAFGGGSMSAPATQAITVNVQAMDARSFLDRSSDIAAAVKDAMLNLNSINDVVNDL